MEAISNESSKAKAKPNVWIVPLAYISHTRCLLQFGKQLARHGVTVTLFCTEVDAKSLGLQNTTLESWKRDGVDIRLKFLHVQTPEVAGGKSDLELWAISIWEMEKPFEVILKHELELGLPKPTCVISDIWLPGIHEISRKYNVPAWSFAPFSAGYVGAAVYISQLESKGILKLPFSPLDKEAQEAMISLPGLPLMPLADINNTWFRYQPMNVVGSRNGPAVEKTEVLILSSFEELEIRTLPELKRLLQNAARNEKREAAKVYAIGPTFPFVSKGTRSTENGVPYEERHPCLKFLDKQPDSSVLLVAFGNDHNHTPEQMQEIACGLEDSMQPFLCALNPPMRTPQFPTGDMLDVISPDCITRTKDRGLFVQGLVPQLEILRHPSTGGFLSHCGQNSCLESMSMGVPMITWPLVYDQMMNARSIVDVQTGLGITKGLDTLAVVDRKEVETKVRALFQSEKGTIVRKTAQKMRELALQSVAENGSTYQNMQALVARIEGLAA